MPAACGGKAFLIWLQQCYLHSPATSGWKKYVHWTNGKWTSKWCQIPVCTRCFRNKVWSEPERQHSLQNRKTAATATLFVPQKRRWPPIPLHRDDFETKIREIMQKPFPLTDDEAAITAHCFQHGGAAREFMLKRLSKEELKDRGGGKWHDPLHIHPKCKITDCGSRSQAERKKTTRRL